MKSIDHKSLSEEDRKTILAGEHYWPEGWPRPYTLEGMLGLTMSCKEGTMLRFELIKNATTGTLFDRKTGRHVFRRDPPRAPIAKKPQRKPLVVSRGGALMSQAMQAASREGVVHARPAD